MNIDIDVCLGSSLLDRRLLVTVQEICQDLAPSWASSLRLWPTKKGVSPIVLTDDPTALYKAVEADIAPGPFYDELVQRFGPPSDPRICGTSEVRGCDRSITLVITVDQRRFCQIGDIWTWGNRLSFQLRRKRVEGVDVISFAKRLFEQVCTRFWMHGMPVPRVPRNSPPRISRVTAEVSNVRSRYCQLATRLILAELL